MGNYEYATCRLALCINQYDASPTCRYHAKMVPNSTMIYDIIKQFYILITDSVYLWACACTPRACASRSYNTCETCVPILHMPQRPDNDDSVLTQCVTLPQSVTQCG